jgi:hypothetical protein
MKDSLNQSLNGLDVDHSKEIETDRVARVLSSKLEHLAGEAKRLGLFEVEHFISVAILAAKSANTSSTDHEPGN